MKHTNDSKQVEMTYAELVAKFRSAERNGIHMTGYIQFTRDSFTEEYSEQARTYGVSSNNKAYRPNMGGYSIYGGSLDGSDPCVRLEQYMADECGGKNGWKVERCYCMLNNKYAILFIRGERPILDEKLDMHKHPYVALTTFGGAEPYRHGRTDFAMGEISVSRAATITPTDFTDAGSQFELLSNEDIEEEFSI